MRPVTPADVEDLVDVLTRKGDGLAPPVLAALRAARDGRLYAVDTLDLGPERLAVAASGTEALADVAAREGRAVAPGWLATGLVVHEGAPLGPAELAACSTAHWRPLADGHTSAIIAASEREDTLVLVADAGHYPTFTHADGRSTATAPHVLVTLGSVTTTVTTTQGRRTTRAWTAAVVSAVG